MECSNVDKVQPLDELLDDKMREFESGKDRVCDKELDTMIWELGDYENEEPPQETGEYREGAPVEEELVEKSITVSRSGRTSFRENRTAAESSSTGEDIATASSIGSEKERKRARTIHQESSRQK